ncbi:MAG: 50S ribosomal protein L9 [Bacteroidales bacterium]|jgi:large subunit ribosomal protein L9|nr:50S ribosomal protein L9 [Bacteroidales bacterium]MDD4175788.1 50S ribosomal protein L9 [Bacteroidales bacterium]MDD4740409.1 50S ribosomal protein L9 [Bacteroidales bacterium]MDY0333412.1 50S ribosomal protein L9 [Bacteroidales bacterium]NCU36116.1 50S ribosomal protein L9 [Candidatus Falkowbacteria bacterium]
MEVILKQDIEKLGYENDTVRVKDGYARNYLIPKGMAIMANATNKKVLAEVQRQKSFKEEKLRNEAETTAKLLEKVNITIGAKAGTSGKIFGSVNAIQIADALAEKGYEIDRRKIIVDGDAIKELGEYTAKVNLYKEIKGEVKFTVVAE